MTELVLAIDAGGTKLLGGLVSRQGEVLHADEVPTPSTAEGSDPGLRELVALATRVANAAGDHGRVVGVGLGFPEYVSAGSVTSSEVFAWDRQPAELLTEVLPGVPVTVEADVRCAAAAEAAARGAGPGSSLFYVSWGTGLSTTLVLSGEPLPGRRGEALAFGEWPVAAAVDPQWNDGLERYAAGRSIGRRYSTLSGTEADGRTVIGLAADGDPVAAGVVDSAAVAVAHALSQVVHLLDPDVIVLGGGLGTSGTRPPSLVAELLPTLLHRAAPPPVVPAVAGSRAGLVGAGLMGFRPGAPG